MSTPAPAPLDVGRLPAHMSSSATPNDIGFALLSETSLDTDSTTPNSSASPHARRLPLCIGISDHDRMRHSYQHTHVHSLHCLSESPSGSEGMQPTEGAAAAAAAAPLEHMGHSHWAVTVDMVPAARASSDLPDTSPCTPLVTQSRRDSHDLTEHEQAQLLPPSLPTPGIPRGSVSRPLQDVSKLDSTRSFHPFLIVLCLIPMLFVVGVACFAWPISLEQVRLATSTLLASPLTDATYLPAVSLSASSSSMSHSAEAPETAAVDGHVPAAPAFTFEVESTAAAASVPPAASPSPNPESTLVPGIARPQAPAPAPAPASALSDTPPESKGLAAVDQGASTAESLTPPPAQAASTAEAAAPAVALTGAPAAASQDPVPAPHPASKPAPPPTPPPEESAAPEPVAAASPPASGAAVTPTVTKTPSTDASADEQQLWHHQQSAAYLNESVAWVASMDRKYSCLAGEPHPEVPRMLYQLMYDFDLVMERTRAQHGMEYAITDGTLLGALRHGGVIPWDDDLDIIVECEGRDRACWVDLMHPDSELRVALRERGLEVVLHNEDAERTLLKLFSLKPGNFLLGPSQSISLATYPNMDIFLHQRRRCNVSEHVNEVRLGDPQGTDERDEAVRKRFDIHEEDVLMYATHPDRFPWHSHPADEPGAPARVPSHCSVQTDHVDLVLLSEMFPRQRLRFGEVDVWAPGKGGQMMTRMFGHSWGHSYHRSFHSHQPDHDFTQEDHERVKQHGWATLRNDRERRSPDFPQVDSCRMDGYHMDPREKRYVDRPALPLDGIVR